MLPLEKGSVVRVDKRKQETEHLRGPEHKDSKSRRTPHTLEARVQRVGQTPVCAGFSGKHGWWVLGKPAWSWGCDRLGSNPCTLLYFPRHHKRWDSILEGGWALGEVRYGS